MEKLTPLESAYARYLDGRDHLERDRSIRGLLSYLHHKETCGGIGPTYDPKSIERAINSRQPMEPIPFRYLQGNEVRITLTDRGHKLARGVLQDVNTAKRVNNIAEFWVSQYVPIDVRNKFAPSLPFSALGKDVDPFEFICDHQNGLTGTLKSLDNEALLLDVNGVNVCVKPLLPYDTYSRRQFTTHRNPELLLVRMDAIPVSGPEVAASSIQHKIHDVQTVEKNYPMAA